MTAMCISYYMATSASIWHMRMRGHAITNLLHDNGCTSLETVMSYGHESHSFSNQESS